MSLCCFCLYLLYTHQSEDLAGIIERSSGHDGDVNTDPSDLGVTDKTVTTLSVNIEEGESNHMS